MCHVSAWPSARCRPCCDLLQRQDRLQMSGPRRTGGVVRSSSDLNMKIYENHEIWATWWSKQKEKGIELWDDIYIYIYYTYIYIYILHIFFVYIYIYYIYYINKQTEKNPPTPEILPSEWMISTSRLIFLFDLHINMTSTSIKGYQGSTDRDTTDTTIPQRRKQLEPAKMGYYMTPAILFSQLKVYQAHRLPLVSMGGFKARSRAKREGAYHDHLQGSQSPKA